MPLKGLSFFVLLCTVLFALSCHRKDTLFTSLSANETGVEFTNNLQKKHLFNILYYLYYYNGGGVATGDVNGDGLPDIYFTANSKGGNKLYINKGAFQFEDVTDKAGVAGTSDWCSGVTMADVNGDGLLDIYVSAVANAHGLKGRNELFINKGNGLFKESATEYGLAFSGFTSQAAFFDYDKDGDLDCFIVNQSHKPHANIVDTSNRHKVDSLSGDRLYRNNLDNGTATFTDVSAQAHLYQSNLGYGLGLAVADFNNDGWEDVYVGNDFHENDYYYINNGDGSFKESGADVFEHYSRFSMGNDAADYNNDGQMDLITVDMLPPDEKTLKTYGSDESPDIYKFKLLHNGFQYQTSRNCLQQNNGMGKSFSETALISGVSATDWSWSPLFADFDNDGAKDLFVSSGIVKRPVDMDYIRFVSNLQVNKGMNQTDAYDEMAIEKMPDGSAHPFLFKGDGNLKFSDVSADWGTGEMKGYYNGAAYADLDNDGDLDLVINCINAPAVILKNNASNTSFSSIQFRGDSLNTFGIGAKAYLFTKLGLQYQQLMLTRGFQSSSDTRLHFGLGGVKSIDSLLIVWPDQSFQLVKNVTANKQLTFVKNDAGGHFEYNQWFKQDMPPLEVLKENPVVDWMHKENDFVDYNVQYLIPHAQSTRGPKIAVADVNGDGLDDFYACGAHGISGALLIQQKEGNFKKTDTGEFEKDKDNEDVDAVFLDANGDGYPDLYVVSGGNQFSGNHPALLDRLYLNDGKGNFKKNAAALPLIYQNKSCAVVSDIDKDGDNDLFIGGLANAKAYGIAQTSYLLLNDGKGKFSVANESQIHLSDIGMVTSAAVADVNSDGWPDLVVAGEWMPIQIYLNKRGQFSQYDIPNSSGWWQTVFVDDVNGDGHLDILGGNWGWNNKFWSGKDEPLKLYVADFDKNGQTDQLFSYTKGGKEYPFLAKDEMERALPVLKKHYLMYADYAGLEMKDAFYGFVEMAKPAIADRLGSAVCYGDGKGGFIVTDLPANLQLAPIFSFQKMENVSGDTKAYVAGGNFFDVIPYEGKYDAQGLAYFTSDKKGNIKKMNYPNLAEVKGQIRDLKWIRQGSAEKGLMVARNNDAPVWLRYNKGF